MNKVLASLKRRKPLVADGATGTMLINKGLLPGECPEKYNLEKPEVLEQIARSYFEAGADIIKSNTFGASPLKLAQYSLDSKTEEINKAAIRAVRKATGGNVFIAASCGPSGRILKPYGDTEPEAISASYARQFKALMSEDIDMILIETMTDLTEATIAIQASKKISPSIPVCATMTFDPTPKGFYTIMGVDINTAARNLAEAGADIIGSNCGNGVENMIRIAREFKLHTDLPLLIQSNAGLPELKNGTLTYPESPEFMAEKYRELIEIGTDILGGCCGTTPNHIKAIRKIVDGWD